MHLELILIAGSVSNSVRGGQWRDWFGLKEKELQWISSDMLNSIFYAALVGALTGNVGLMLASAVCMNIGARPAWGDYIGALGGWRKDVLEELSYIDPIISPLKRFPRVWGFAGLLLRGVLWGVCLAAPFLYFGYGSITTDFVICAAMMPIAYAASIFWAASYTKNAGYGWGLGELVYGAILWSPLAAL